MAAKLLEVTGIGEVAFYKRRGSRSIRLSIAPNRTVRVTMPYWLPYSAGMEFVHSKSSWIQKQLDEQAVSILKPGQRIGKVHHLDFKTGPHINAITGRLQGKEIIVNYPMNLSWDNKAVQDKARQSAIRALRKEAEQALPARLQDLAIQHDLSYRSVSIKHLKRRWGSCDQNKNIVFNLFLIQLPWDLIDYVILHELTHTRFLNHSPDFWQYMDSLSPNIKEVRKQIRKYQPAI